jgi:hypothetical protein
MQRFFNGEEIDAGEGFIYMLTKTTPGKEDEKRYMMVQKKYNGQTLIKDVTLDYVEKRKEKALPLDEAITILEHMIYERAKLSEASPEYAFNLSPDGSSK